MLKKVLFVLICCLGFNVVYAAAMDSPVGNWITISDKTRDRSGLINIYEQNGKLYGKIFKIFPGSGRNPNAICDKCPPPFKDKPVVGLVFLWDFMPTSNTDKWENGKF